jgi:hypothetical protein
VESLRAPDSIADSLDQAIRVPLRVQVKHPNNLMQGEINRVLRSIQEDKIDLLSGLDPAIRPKGELALGATSLHARSHDCNLHHPIAFTILGFP